MVDTNILVSIAVFKSRILTDLFSHICLRHKLVLSTYIIDEFERVVEKKFSSKMANVSAFLQKLPFELEYTPFPLPNDYLFTIRDIKDAPILYSAISADVDILITGDNDLLTVEIDRPLITTASIFMEGL